MTSTTSDAEEIPGNSFLQLAAGTFSVSCRCMIVFCLLLEIILSCGIATVTEPVAVREEKIQEEHMKLKVCSDIFTLDARGLNMPLCSMACNKHLIHEHSLFFITPSKREKRV